MREAYTYRGARRNFARECKLDWRQMPRIQVRRTGQVQVELETKDQPRNVMRAMMAAFLKLKSA
jgi:hypothetical protein